MSGDVAAMVLCTGLDTGTHVPVVHLPERPDTARVFTRAHRMVPLVARPIGGTVFLGTGVLIALTR